MEQQQCLLPNPVQSEMIACWFESSRRDQNVNFTLRRSVVVKIAGIRTAIGDFFRVAWRVERLIGWAQIRCWNRVDGSFVIVDASSMGGRQDHQFRPIFRTVLRHLVYWVKLLNGSALRQHRAIVQGRAYWKLVLPTSRQNIVHGPTDSEIKNEIISQMARGDVRRVRIFCPRLHL